MQSYRLEVALLRFVRDLGVFGFVELPPRLWLRLQLLLVQLIQAGTV